MAFDKDAFLTALDSMSVMELNDLVKAIEEKFGVSAAAMAAPAGGGGGGAAAAGRRREDRVQRDADRSRRQQGVGHQGGARNHRPGPEGSQGPGRRRAEGRQGSASPRPTPKPPRRSWKTPAPRPSSSNRHLRDKAGRRHGARPFVLSRVFAALRALGKRTWRKIEVLFTCFQVFSDPTAENGFGRAPVQCRGCPPAAGSGQPPSFERKARQTVASRRRALPGPSRELPERSDPWRSKQSPTATPRRKRIRKSFGKRESVLNVPYLLTMQKDSYVAFLQKDVPPQKRKPEGLQAAFLSAFPIVSHNGFVEMKFIEYNLAKPAFDTRECQQRGLTYAAAVRAKLQMIIYDRESRAGQDGQGDQGAGGLHGRSAAHDRLRLVHRQRHRARDRLAAAPLAGRVLRARQGQDAQLAASCCSRRASFPTAARGSTSSSTRRTSCTSASTAAARCR